MRIVGMRLRRLCGNRAVDAALAGCLILSSGPAAAQTVVRGSPVPIQTRRSLPGIDVLSIAVDPLGPDLYVGTGALALSGESPEVWKSPDGGSEWSLTSFSAGDPTFGGASFVVVDPSIAGTVYASFRTCYFRLPMFCGGQLFRSEDGGGSWQALRSGSMVTLLPDRHEPGTLYALDLRPVMDPRFPADPQMIGFAIRSRDSGASWSDLPLSSPSTLALNPAYPGWLLAGSPSGLFRSVDGGDTWVASSEGLTSPIVRALSIAGDGVTAYVATDGGVFRSSDAGESWEATGSLSYTTQLAVDSEDPATVYVVSLTGLFRSTNGGSEWSRVGVDPAIVETIALDSTGTILYVGTTDGLIEVDVRKSRTLTPRIAGAPFLLRSSTWR